MKSTNRLSSFAGNTNSTAFHLHRLLICYLGIYLLAVELPPNIADRLRYPSSIVEKVRQLAASVGDPEIAAELNQQGLLSAKGKPFTASMVKWLRYKHCISDFPETRMDFRLESRGKLQGVHHEHTVGKSQPIQYRIFWKSWTTVKTWPPL